MLKKTACLLVSLTALFCSHAQSKKTVILGIPESRCESFSAITNFQGEPLIDFVNGGIKSDKIRNAADEMKRRVNQLSFTTKYSKANGQVWTYNGEYDDAIFIVKISVGKLLPQLNQPDLMIIKQRGLTIDNNDVQTAATNALDNVFDWLNKDFSFAGDYARLLPMFAANGTLQANNGKLPVTWQVILVKDQKTLPEQTVLYKVPKF